MNPQNDKYPAVYIDRDGTINVEAGYISHPDNFALYPFAAHAIRLLNIKQFYVFIVTNQTGLAKGYFGERALNDIHKKMTTSLKKSGAIIDKIYVCPHDKNSIIKKYRKDCDCKKPKAGLILKSFKDYTNIDRDNIYIIGDKLTDMDVSKHIKFRKTILVKTGYGLSIIEKIKKNNINSITVVENLLYAALEILKENY
jgi:D-glycero-D-manno-heptose 1,7-bisphosphate phosphatase